VEDKIFRKFETQFRVQMSNKKNFWIGVSLFNLFIVASLGFVLRSKILFSLPSINYKNLLSAHSHFAFGGWAALALITLLVYDLLSLGDKKIYQWVLWSIQLTSLGMALTFPFTGYALLSIIFSTLHIFSLYVFAFAFIGDARKRIPESSTRLLAISSVISLVISSIGPFGLAFMMATGRGNANFHRDFIYTFLHFQYNGFFILAALSLFMDRLVPLRTDLSPLIRKLSVILSLSILPTLFLSLLWHNQTAFYIIAILGCGLIILGLFYFVKLFIQSWSTAIFRSFLARSFFILSFLSLALKMLLQVGPIFPDLGNAVYGDRPLIIGFLHLVFLGFLTFYLLATYIEEGYFTKSGKTIGWPLYLFGFGIIVNEILLMLQGLGILFFYNTSLYNWFLWGNSIILVLGSAGMASALALKSRHSTTGTHFSI